MSYMDANVAFAPTGGIQELSFDEIEAVAGGPLPALAVVKLVISLGPVDKGDSQKGQYLIQGSFWGGYLDPGFDERRGMGLP